MAGLSATLLRAGRGSASLLRACGDSLASEERAERGLACTGRGTVDFDEADDFKDLKETSMSKDFLWQCAGREKFQVAIPH